MTDWPDIAATYDAVAKEYAEAFADELRDKPFDRALLARYAAAVPSGAPVWDVGCGPAAHVAEHLAGLGLAVSGVDVSVGSLVVARSRHPGMPLVAADLRALPVADGRLAGLVAFYSAIHLPRAELPAALAGMSRALRPGGSLLVAMHGGDGELDAAGWFGHDVTVRATLVGRDELVSLVEGSGLVVREAHLREPYDFEHPTARLYARATRL